MIIIQVLLIYIHAVESPNKGQFRVASFVLCKEFVLFGRVKNVRTYVRTYVLEL